MENIKYIREIMRNGSRKNGVELGNCLFFVLNKDCRAKLYVDGGGIYHESHGIMVEIIDKNNGVVDKTYFPFQNYFASVQCSPNAPKWFPHIVRGEWYFNQYPHCLPKKKDFENIANAVCAYMDMFA